MTTSDDVLRKIIELRGGTLAEFRERHNTDPHVQRNRHLAVILLGNHWGDRRDGRIAIKLDCSPAFMEQALRLTDNDREFCDQLERLEPELFEGRKKEPEVPQETGGGKDAPSRGSSTDLLFRIAKEHYGYDKASLFEAPNGQRTAYVRRIMMCIGREFLSMGERQAADMLDCMQATASRILQQASYDYDYDDHFKKEVNLVCERFGIPLQRRVKPSQTKVVP